MQHFKKIIMVHFAKPSTPSRFMRYEIWFYPIGFINPHNTCCRDCKNCHIMQRSQWMNIKVVKIWQKCKILKETTYSSTLIQS